MNNRKQSLSNMNKEPFGENKVVSPSGPESVKYIIPSESNTIEFGPCKNEERISM